jgi:hypothetical protein
VATSPRCLCLVLTLWIAVLCLSAAVRTGSPDSVWWGTKESAQLQDSVRKRIRTGNFAAGKGLFDKCLGEGLRCRHKVGRVANLRLIVNRPVRDAVIKSTSCEWVSGEAGSGASNRRYSGAGLGSLTLAEAAAASNGSRKNGARREQARGSATLAVYTLVFERHLVSQWGRIRLTQERTLAALKGLNAALDLAARWSWAEVETCATELNRAPGLKTLKTVWRPRKRPVEFWKILSNRRAAHMRLLRLGLRKSPAPGRFRLRPTEMEAQAGLGVSLNPTENFPNGDSLIHFQQGLRASEVLLSFDLGERSVFHGSSREIRRTLTP